MSKRSTRCSVVVAATIGLLGCGKAPTGQAGDLRPPAPTVAAKVLKTLPHDPAAFTQGLLIEDGVLYESTGQYGDSTVRSVNLETGKPTQVVELSDRVFAEGLVAVGDRLVVLTWKAGVAIAFDRATLKPVARTTYRGEGWGLTTDGDRLYFSDGSSTIKIRDQSSFRVVGTIAVTDRGRPVEHLNELEWVDGELYANIWFDPRIARIDPTTGRVIGWIDCTALVRRYRRGEQQVLNGIAYDRDADRLFVTGKYWPVLVEISRPAD